MRTYTGHAISAAGPGRNCPRALRRIKEIYGGLGGLGFPCSNMKLPLSAALKCASSYGHFTALDSCSRCLCWKGIRSFQKYFHPYTGTSSFFSLKKKTPKVFLRGSELNTIDVTSPHWPSDFMSMGALSFLFYSLLIENMFLYCWGDKLLNSY